MTFKELLNTDPEVVHCESSDDRKAIRELISGKYGVQALDIISTALHDNKEWSGLVAQFIRTRVTDQALGGKIKCARESLERDEPDAITHCLKNIGAWAGRGVNLCAVP